MSVVVQPGGRLQLNLYVRRSWQRQVVSVWREGRAAFPDVTLNITRGSSLVQLLSMKAFEGDDRSQAEGRINEARYYLEGHLGFRLSEKPLLLKQYQLEDNQFNLLCGQGGKIMRSMTMKLGLGIRSQKRNQLGWLWVEGIDAAINEFEKEVAGILNEEIKEFQPKSWAAKVGGGLERPAKKLKPLKPSIDPEHGEITECLFFENNDHKDQYDMRIFLDYLRAGHRSLDICVFTITYNQIANAIMAEFRDGVNVRIITDNDKAKDLGSDIYKLAKAGIPIKVDKTEVHMHHKFAVIDGKLLINGSFNWTRSAQSRNFENVVISNNEKMVQSFQNHFNHLWNNGSMEKLEY